MLCDLNLRRLKSLSSNMIVQLHNNNEEILNRILQNQLSTWLFLPDSTWPCVMQNKGVAKYQWEHCTTFTSPVFTLCIFCSCTAPPPLMYSQWRQCEIYMRMDLLFIPCTSLPDRLHVNCIINFKYINSTRRIYSSKNNVIG